MTKALITGITGQDGSYLAEFVGQGLRGSRVDPPLQHHLLNTTASIICTDFHDPNAK